MEKVNNDDVYETCDDIEPLLLEEPEENEVTKGKKLTPAQLAAIRFSRETREVYDQSARFLKESIRDLSKKDTDYDDPSVLLSAIITLTSQQKKIKAELDILRPLLKESLLRGRYRIFKKGVAKIFFLGKVISVSESGKSSSTLKFDETRFKKENPELWKQYCVKTYTGGCGGTLTIRDMTQKQKAECYKIDTKVKEVIPWEK